MSVMNDLKLFDGIELAALIRVDMDNNHFEGALAKIKTALAQQNPPLIIQAFAAQLYAQLKIFDRAITHYENFLKDVPEAITEQFQYGMVHFEMDQIDRAVEIWSQVLQKHATHPPALFYSAIAQLRMNNRADAQRHLEVILKSAPADNRYFVEAKELINQLEHASQQSQIKDTNTLEHTPTKNPYKTDLQ